MVNAKVGGKKIVGIDLGTTNSVVAVLEGGNPNIIVNSEGARTTPSVVAYRPDGQTLVGQLAKRQAVVNPDNTFYSVKRLIGCKFTEIENEIPRLSYEVKKDENSKVKICAPAVQKEFSPEEISALILKKLVTDASRFLNDNISKAIITVPAYFNDSQRMATKDAGVIAGLEVLRILNEPTAAALAYGLDKKVNEVILIFDLGGGTFDVSILEVGEEIFEVLATAGDTHLGGDDFDQVIVQFVLEKFKNEEGIDLSKEKQALQRIIEASEKAKIELSSLQSTQISLPFIFVNDKVPKNIDYTITRLEFEQFSSSLLTRCLEPIKTSLKDASLTKEEIDQVILVGGSTRIPAVRELVLSFLQKPVNEGVNPDEVVAMGAAVQAGIIAGEITDLILLDVTPLSLGVETLGGLTTTLINRNSSIPTKQSEVFSTSSDYQESVDIHVLQGERPFAKDNKSLGIFKLNDIPREPQGVPKINVTFQLDVDGLLSVSAREEKTGIEQSIKIEGAALLGREEIGDMVKEAEENAIKDKAQKSFVNIVYEIDNLLSKTDMFFDEKFYQSSTLPFEEIYCLLIHELSFYLKNNKFEIVKILVLSLQQILSEFIESYLRRMFSSSNNISSKVWDILDYNFETKIKEIEKVSNFLSSSIDDYKLFQVFDYCFVSSLFFEKVYNSLKELSKIDEEFTKEEKSRMLKLCSLQLTSSFSSFSNSSLILSTRRIPYFCFSSELFEFLLSSLCYPSLNELESLEFYLSSFGKFEEKMLISNLNLDEFLWSTFISYKDEGNSTFIDLIIEKD